MDQINHKEREHALLSASGATRWMACAPSALLEDNFPELSSRWADEGTARHEIAEQILRNKLDGKRMPAFRDPDKKQMAEDVMPYVQYVLQTFDKIKKEHSDAVIMLEQHVRFDDWVPGGFGSADAIIIAGGTLTLIDLKNGHMKVQAVGNPQLRLYALGALQEYDFIYDIEQVEYVIVQPPLDHVDSELVVVDELYSWADYKVKPAAELALSGKGLFVEGEHCKYCKAVHCCRHRLNTYQAIADLMDKKPAELASTGDIATVLRNADSVTKFIKACTDFAVDAMQHGVKYPGCKLIEGRGSSALIDGAEATLVQRLVNAGADKDLIYKPAELATKTELQKLVGKKVFEGLTADLYKKIPGKLKVDKAESSKPEWTPPNSAVSDFDGEELSEYVKVVS